MLFIRNLILLVCVLCIFGCESLPSLDEVLTDKRKTYQKSRDLPALEVPPDLTVTEGEYAAAIPSDEEANTLSEFQRQRAAGTRKSIGGAVLGGGQSEGEQWLALQGSSVDIWGQLEQFWNDKGYVIDLNDPELGVMETGWKEGESDKHRFKIFAEPGESNDTVIFLSSERQELLEGAWLEATPDAGLEKKIIRKMSLHFYGTEFEETGSIADNGSTSATPSTPKKVRPKAEILSLGEGKSYLAIPQEFTRAWRDTELVLQRAGYVIQDKSQEKGTYNILFYKPQEKKEEGLLSKLKFWGDDEDEGTPYQLSLTGVGNKTEIIVMGEDGEWDTGENAASILAKLKELYNRL
ncbi:MAG: outer membrane protein assembly factor BamC [Proteobacteria bacterium]|nr:outer membrane protein assembly factor BamC [Pseudomonadota bacterium]NOG61544.1 outer membrane protein assembly factor BamC [Pseudomonadota bacterium]